MHRGQIKSIISGITAVLIPRYISFQAGIKSSVASEPSETLSLDDAGYPVAPSLKAVSKARTFSVVEALPAAASQPSHWWVEDECDDFGSGSSTITISIAKIGPSAVILSFN